MLFLGLAAKDEDAIHVNDHNSFVYEFLEDVVHNHLEHCWAISEAEGHDQRFK